MYPISMMPGPVDVPKSIFRAMNENFGSADLEPEFLETYKKAEVGLAKLMGTKNDVVIMTGEGMVVLWSALKSCIKPKDKVLALSTGLFGSGIGEMAISIGGDVQILEFREDSTFSEWDKIENAIKEFQPKMITAVHCETPCGTLNPLAKIGELKKKYGVPLFCVDAVASIGGCPVCGDDWNIDIVLGGSQKCLSVPPFMAFMAVSAKAWEVIEQVQYEGYDALLPFRSAKLTGYFPYTPCWHGVEALNVACQEILAEGSENVFARHEKIAKICREGLVEAGIKIFPLPEAISSPTVTAAYVPENIGWVDFDAALRAQGIVTGGNYGYLAHKIFRFGHMGSQANLENIDAAINGIKKVMRNFK